MLEIFGTRQRNILVFIQQKQEVNNMSKSFQMFEISFLFCSLGRKCISKHKHGVFTLLTNEYLTCLHKIFKPSSPNEQLQPTPLNSQNFHLSILKIQVSLIPPINTFKSFKTRREMHVKTKSICSKYVIELLRNKPRKMGIKITCSNTKNTQEIYCESYVVIIYYDP